MLEICLLTPAVLLLAAGLIGLAGYFYIGQRVQMIADQAVRSAATAPTMARPEVARLRVQQELDRRGMARGAVIVSLDEEGDRLSLQLTYDASRAAIFALDALIPMPSSTIVRYAAATRAP